MTLSLYFVIPEKLNKKVNPKKNIELSSWILEVDKNARQKLGAQGLIGLVIRGDGDREGRRGSLGRAWRNGMVRMEKGWLWEHGSRYLN